MLATSLYERSLFIDTDKYCAFGCAEENFCGGVRNPTKELVEVWNYSQIGQDVEAWSWWAFCKSEVWNFSAHRHCSGAAAGERGSGAPVFLHRLPNWGVD